MKTNYSSLEADTGLLVERLGVAVPERDQSLLSLGAIDEYNRLCDHMVADLWPPFAPWWTDEDVRRHFPTRPSRGKGGRRG